MGKIDVTYTDLEGITPKYVEALRAQEHAVRQAVAKIGRSCSVRWVSLDDGHGHLFFRLTAYADRSDCIAQFAPLDLTLAPDAFEKLITEGKRPCS